MKTVTVDDLKGLYRPAKDSHKGQNGKLLVIGGSKLFHASVFWAADVASRIVDLVHFSSPAMENNDLVRQKAKAGFWNGIVVPWERVEEYIDEDDCVVIGPGMPRKEGQQKGDIDTAEVTNRLLRKFPEKRWVIDGGALQEMDKRRLNERMIVTPHAKEFQRLFGVEATADKAWLMAKEYGGVVLLKGQVDFVCSRKEMVEIRGGNEGMTKGGTGDVLAGLVGALYCKNEAWLSAVAGSCVNKQAGDNLYRKVGPFFNASDLVTEVAGVMKGVWAQGIVGV